MNACVAKLQAEAMKHAVLDAERMSGLSKRGVLEFAYQCYEFVRCFPLFLGMLIANLPKEEHWTLMVLVDNLVDECGGYEMLSAGDISGAHPRLFRRLFVALGAT